MKLLSSLLLASMLYAQPAFQNVPATSPLLDPILNGKVQYSQGNGAPSGNCRIAGQQIHFANIAGVDRLYVCSGSIWQEIPIADSTGTVSFPGSIKIGTTFSTVAVGGVTRAVKYTSAAGAISRLDILLDATVTDYGVAATVGSIQWAIDAIPATGGKVHLGCGIFPISTAITIAKASVVLEGEGNCTQIRMANGANLAAMVNYTSAGPSYYFFKLLHIQLQGNQANNASAGPCFLMDGTGNNDVLIDDVFIQDCKGDGMRFDHAWGVRIVNSLSEYNGGNGINFTANALETFLSNLYLYSNGANGLTISGSTSSLGVQVTNVRSEANTQYGVSVSGQSHVFTSIVLKDNGSGGLLANSASNSLFSNLRIVAASPPTWGIVVQGGSGSRYDNVIAAGSGTTDIEILSGSNHTFSNITATTISDAGIGTNWNVSSNKKYSVIKIANGAGGCANAKGCWAVNGGTAVAAATATTQAITWLAAPANAKLERVRWKTTVACAGITAITLSSMGTTSSASEFFTGGTYNLKTAVGATNLLWPVLLTPGLTTAATNWSITVAAGAENVDDITDGCAFDIEAKWAVMP